MKLADGFLTRLICDLWWSHCDILYWEEWKTSFSWWHHQMETFSALLALCAGNLPVTGEFPAQRPVTQSLDVFFDLRLDKRLSKQSWGWWFETPSRSLWCHCNVYQNLKESAEIFIWTVMSEINLNHLLTPCRNIHTLAYWCHALVYGLVYCIGFFFFWFF